MALNTMTLEEVRGLASNAASCIRRTEAEVVILVHPMYVGNVSQGVNKELSSMSSQYSKDLRGIPMAFEKVRISSDGGLFHTNPFIHLNVRATFYVFSPEVGSVLEGSVQRKSPNHLSCLVHKTFNISVPKPHNTPAESWEGTSLDEGDAVTLVLTDVNMSFHLPMITGRIVPPVNNPATGVDEKPRNNSMDSGISSEYDEDGEKKIKAVKKKDKKGDKKKKLKVVSKKKGVKDKVKAEKKKMKKEKEEKKREKTEKKKKKKKDEKEKKKKGKKKMKKIKSKEITDEKQAKKEKKKKDKKKKDGEDIKKEKKKRKHSIKGSDVVDEITSNIKIEQSDGANAMLVIKSEMNSPVKMDAKQSILDKQIKVEKCSNTSTNIPSTSGFGRDTSANQSAMQFGLEVETGDFNDDDFFGRRKSTSAGKTESKKIKKEQLDPSPSKDALTIKKRKLEQSPEKRIKKRKIEN